MGCESCANGKNGTPAGCRNNGTCSSGGCDKLAVFDWLGNMELPGNATPFEYVEVRFKSTRKEFFLNATHHALNIGDCVTVEGSPGTDVGIVSAAGELARLQMNQKGVSTKSPREEQGKRSGKNVRDLKKVLHKATETDLETWREARSREQDTMRHARTIADGIGLDMKICDVEFQGDNTKMTVYYTAAGRVDFRELIRRYAEAFGVRIEMKQIGARQEAGRLGGIGSCGRELCCSTWLTDFRTVTTAAARYQQLALNTQKLAGQCGKLKCCLNYELDSYLDALKDFPKRAHRIQTKHGRATNIKTDIFKGIMWYVMDDERGTPLPIEVERVKELLALNAENKTPESLKDFAIVEESVEKDYSDAVGQDSLTRFDKKKGKKNKGRGKHGGKGRKNQARTKGKSNSSRDGKRNSQKSDKPNEGNRAGKHKKSGGRSKSRKPRGEARDGRGRGGKRDGKTKGGKDSEASGSNQSTEG